MTLKELLTSMLEEEVKTKNPSLPNTADTWSRIANKDSFEELGLEASELDTFLKEWTSENSYQNIK